MVKGFFSNVRIVVAHFYTLMRRSFEDIRHEYPLRLDTIIDKPNTGEKRCILQVAWSSHYASFTPEEILKTNKLRRQIDPDDLLTIKSLADEIESQKQNLCIEYENRDGTFKLSNGQIISIKGLNEQSQIIKSLDKKDLYVIACSKGFNEGREISKEIRQTKEKQAIRKRSKIHVMK